MKNKEFYSTGEASTILNISRATVTRKFDSGELKGTRNPITGERLISRGSIISFLKKYNVPVPPFESKASNYTVILCSKNEQIISYLYELFPPVGMVKIIKTDSIYEALILLVKKSPKLFIVDDTFSCDVICKSLKNMEEFENIKILCISTSNDKVKMKKIIADDYIYQDSLNKDTFKKKVFTLLNLHEGYRSTGLRFNHQRRWPRVSVNIPATLEIHLKVEHKSPRYCDTRIKNISLGGAFLDNICIDTEGIPLKDFSLVINIKQKPLENWQTECKFSRINLNESLNAGVEFVNLSEANRNKISKLVG